MFLIRSGIPSLEEMFGPGNPTTSDPTWNRDERGIYVADTRSVTSICIAGPDGTGKSVLAMHFASRYIADCHHFISGSEGQPKPLAFYVSSDLSYAKADAMWKNFRLDSPNARQIPFRREHVSDERLPKWLGRRSKYDKSQMLQLTSHAPDDLDALAEHLRKSNDESRQVAFIDLASHTAGDDWGFVERLLAAMPVPPRSAPRHLLVIDAMEGMETFAGDVDAFGHKTTRRGRVAKLMRLASTKCHLLLVIEEPAESERLAEQFVADVVLRLRATEDHGYSRRTLEIEKARGQSHVRGRHPYVIRDGRGSTTGEQVNFDDPRVDFDGTAQSYIDVFPSLHSISRGVMQIRSPSREKPSDLRAGFGIPGLDEMLAAESSDSSDVAEHGHDPNGLPCGTVSALIGDANTQKSFLALAFLGHVFHQLAWKLMADDPAAVVHPLDKIGWSDKQVEDPNTLAHERYVQHLCSAESRFRGLDKVAPRELPEEVRRWAWKIDSIGRGHAGVVVLVTTKDETNRTLGERFYDQLNAEIAAKARHESGPLSDRVDTIWRDPVFKTAFSAYLESRTICRRLEIHDTPSPILYHSIRRAVEAGQEIVKRDTVDVCSGWPEKDSSNRIESGWRIRFVLDDFNTVMRTYGRVHDDPLFLPFLLLNLRREGLSSLIVETQSGTRGVPQPHSADEVPSDLRALSDYRLYTWHVQNFFGDHRIAIAAIPPMVQQNKKSPVLVRELEWYEPNSRSVPKVKPTFELYAGLDTPNPTLVPLRVHLYAETPAWEGYISRLDMLWRRVFEPVSVETATAAARPHVVVAEKASNYDLMRDVCDLLSNTTLDYSLVVQIDEFWSHSDVFRPQNEYLTRPIEGPVEVTPEGQRVSSWNKRDEWFEGMGYGLRAEPDESEPRIDRVPFVWDFGFLACQERLWNEATKADPPRGSSERVKVKRDEANDVWENLKNNRECSWPEFLEAASYVAQWESARQSRTVSTFDLAMVAPETFSCLVLEIWFSEIYKTDRAKAARIGRLMKHRRWSEESHEFTLASLVKHHWVELYSTWLLLAESLDLSAFDPREEGFGFAFGHKPNANAVAIRHWYRSAALLDAGAEGGPIRYCRLPGSFSVRGDWFLAAVRGSRSDRLVDRALDLLSTQESNVDRLLRGLGLPTRRMELNKPILSSRLRGWHRTAQADDGDREAEEAGTLTYDEVVALGAGHSPDFHWLWRGNLTHYHASAAIWERWLYRVLRRWKRTREFFASDWISGFELCGMIRKNQIKEVATKTVTYWDFERMCMTLRNELEQVTSEAAKES